MRMKPPPLLAAATLFVVGLSQMAGDLFSVPALRDLAAATAASPAPKIFSAARGLDPNAVKLFLEYTDRQGKRHSDEITPELYARIRGPLNRRSVYGAILTRGPVLATDPRTEPMYTALMKKIGCGGAALIDELGLAHNAYDVWLRVVPLPGVDLGGLPALLEAKCL